MNTRRTSSLLTPAATGRNWLTVPIVLVTSLVAGFWPVWCWYGARMSDGSDEPLGLFALIAAACFLAREWRSWLEPHPNLVRNGIGAVAATIAYLALYSVMPPLIRASFAVLALALLLPTQSSQPRLPLLALLLLSLPLIATLQYFLGFPMRVVTAWCSAHVLQLFGNAVEAQGTILLWAGEEVLIDAPCSGIRMLWTAATLSSALACIHRLPPWQFFRLAQLTGAAVFAGNVGRSVVLFFLETGQWPRPSWAHEGAGLGIFGVAIVVCTLAAGRLARKIPGERTLLSATERKSGRAGMPALRDGTGAFHAALIVALSGMAAVRPWIVDTKGSPSAAGFSVDWPAVFEGAPLEPVALHPVEARFAESFPGAFAAFTDGRRRIVFRRIDTATRKVHPAAGCLRAAGFSVKPLPATRMSQSGLWAALRAEKPGETLRVREQIRGSDGSSWTDVSAWYWAALFQPGSGPWTAITVMEEQRG